MKKTNLIVCLSVLLVTLAAGFAIAEKKTDQSLNRAIIKVDKLTCGACFSTISSGLETLDGYSGMGANLFRKLIAVDFSVPLTQEAIAEKLTEVGYPGTVKSVGTISEKESFAKLESRGGGLCNNGGGGCCPKK